MVNVSKDTLVSMLQSLDSSTLFEVQDEFLEGDDRVYPMDEYEELNEGKSLMDAIRDWTFGYRYNPYNSDKRDYNNLNDDYYAYNGYGNITTIEDDSDLAHWIADNVEDNDAVAEWLIENGHIDADDWGDDD